MNTKKLPTMVLGLALVLGMAGQAYAVPMTYNVAGTFNDGGTVSGTMDVDSSAFILGFVTDWNLTTSGGSSGISGFTYDTSSSSIGFFGLQNTNNLTVLFQGNLFANRSLELSGYTPTLNNPGPYSIGTITESTKAGLFSRRVTRTGSGTGSGNVATPEPASLLLFGSGLAGLGLLRYRKFSKSK